MLFFHKLDNAIEVAKGVTYSLAGGGVFAAASTFERVSASLTTAVPAILAVLSAVFTWWLSRVRDRKQFERQQEFEDLKSKLDQVLAIAEVEAKTSDKTISQEALRLLIRKSVNAADAETPPSGDKPATQAAG
jgi:uncharacterized protein (DUF697 family)